MLLILDLAESFNQWKSLTRLLLGCCMVSKLNVFQLKNPYCTNKCVFEAMKSLVNWPSNEKHKLPEYHGSEKDVFKVICDYFTNASSPLTTFCLYNLLVEAFIRTEAADLKFRKPQEQSEDNEEEAFSISSKGSVQSLVMKMASPVPHKTSTPLSTCPLADYYST